MADQSDNPPTKNPRHASFAATASMGRLPADEFVSSLTMFDEPKVKVIVGSSPFVKTFSLPLALLCHHSSFFEAAFKGSFKETIEKSLTMEMDDPKAFEMIIQWLYTGIMVPQLGCDKLGAFINVIVLADKLFMEGPNRDAMTAVRNIVQAAKKEDKIIKFFHIHAGQQLPKQHALRSLLATACVKSYALSIVGKANFAFAQELDEFEGFSSDMGFALAELLRTGGGQMKRDCPTEQPYAFLFYM